MGAGELIGHRFFHRDSVVCARQMIGMTLLWQGCGGTIVETEAYRAEGDPACHTFFRKSAREFVQQHEPGAAYVYLNYGVHWLFNLLTKSKGNIGFVLVRAMIPEHGLEQMVARRNGTTLGNLCSGPGKLTQALGLNGQHHGVWLWDDPEFQLQSAVAKSRVLADGRIGIRRAVEYPWRFTSARDQQWVSRKWQAPTVDESEG